MTSEVPGPEAAEPNREQVPEGRRRRFGRSVIEAFASMGEGMYGYGTLGHLLPPTETEPDTKEEDKEEDNE